VHTSCVGGVEWLGVKKDYACGVAECGAVEGVGVLCSVV
jgi:hypothetical protein